ncbi:MAG: hypothetical protein KUG79_09830 [Pseudomonadales bacterium]|nr:hypothetical protein [Pseudomonadales bacterium]
MNDSVKTKTSPASDNETAGKKWQTTIAKLTTWLITVGCFYLIYSRVELAAARDGLSAVGYLQAFFLAADWFSWLLLMIPYSIYFFLIDAHATWRLVRWFNTSTLKFTNILPIRASAYILSLLNEQVGKGAISLYLLRRYDVPVWQAVSSMIMLGMVEIYQLLLFSAVGVLIYYDLVVQASTNYPLPTIMLTVYSVAFIYLPLHILYFKGYLLKGSSLRDKQLFHAFRRADIKHYFLLLLFKAPNLLGAVFVYTFALSLFKVDVGFGQMMAFLPVIFLAAALPLPFHAGALVLWTVLFPGYPEVGVFSMVMHTFFVLFNAVIGMIFLPRANRELFAD